MSLYNSTMVACPEDAYSSVCQHLPRLCPRLVPSPLWGLSVANLARADAEVVCGVAYGSVDQKCLARVEEIREWWFSLPRGVCSACGSPARHIDEEWSYCLEEGVGVALLTGLSPLCDKCHLAKHLGYAKVTRKYREALSHLAGVNGVGLREAQKLADDAFRIHEDLSRVWSWRVGFSSTVKAGGRAAEAAEEILALMAAEGYDLSGWLHYYAHPDQRGGLEERAYRESLGLLNRALGGGGKLRELLELLRLDPQARWAVVRILEEALRPHRVEILGDSVEAALEGASPRPPTTSKVEVLEIESRDEETEDMLQMLLMIQLMRGKWISFVPSGLRGVVVRRIVDRLKEAGLDYIVETTLVGKRGRDREPVMVSLPSFIASELVGEVAEILASTLRELGVGGLLMFKPEIFDKADKRRSGKPYIYKKRIA